MYIHITYNVQQPLKGARYSPKGVAPASRDSLAALREAGPMSPVASSIHEAPEASKMVVLSTMYDIVY